jgi:rhodanese-related sulfurtransferase
VSRPDGAAGSAVPPRFGSIDELLADARSHLHRLNAQQTVAAVEAGARLVDIRPAWQRGAEGEITGALIVERNHLEWRLHPGSDSRLSAAESDQRWIVVCSEGFTSSLAADSLRSLGIDATDLIGGVQAWIVAGLPTVDSCTDLEHVVGAADAERADVKRSVHLGDRGVGDVEDKPTH